MALRICCISDEVVLVMASMVPVDVPSNETSVLYHAKCMEEQPECNNTARSEPHDFCNADVPSSFEGPVYAQAHSEQ